MLYNSTLAAFQKINCFSENTCKHHETPKCPFGTKRGLFERSRLHTLARPFAAAIRDARFLAAAISLSRRQRCPRAAQKASQVRRRSSRGYSHMMSALRGLGQKQRIVPGPADKRLTGNGGKLNTSQAEPVAASSWAVGHFLSFSCGPSTDRLRDHGSVRGGLKFRKFSGHPMRMATKCMAGGRGDENEWHA